MKYYKFENWWGKLIVKDVVKARVKDFWEFMETGMLTHNFSPINNFHKNDQDIYWVNGEL